MNKHNAVGQGEKPNLGVSTFEPNSPGGNQKISTTKGSTSDSINSPGAQQKVSTSSKGSKFEMNRPGGAQEAGRKFGPVGS